MTDLGSLEKRVVTLEKIVAVLTETVLTGRPVGQPAKARKKRGPLDPEAKAALLARLEKGREAKRLRLEAEKAEAGTAETEEAIVETSGPETGEDDDDEEEAAFIAELEEEDRLETEKAKRKGRRGKRH